MQHPFRGRISDWVDERMAAFVAEYRHKNQFEVSTVRLRLHNVLLQVHRRAIAALRRAAATPAPLSVSGQELGAVALEVLEWYHN